MSVTETEEQGGEVDRLYVSVHNRIDKIIQNVTSTQQMMTQANGAGYLSQELQDKFHGIQQSASEMAKEMDQSKSDNKINIEILRTNEEAVKNLEKDVSELTSIVQDLGAFTQEQESDLLLRNAVRSTDDTGPEVPDVVIQPANAELTKAFPNVIRMRRRRCVFIIVICVVILSVVGLVLGLMFG